MILASVGSTAYNVVFILHILSIVAAFAPAVIHPLMASQYRGAPPDDRTRFAAFVSANNRRVYGPALLAVGAFGLGLVLLSDDAWAFDQTWVSAAFAVWFVLVGIQHGVLFPAERKLAAGDRSAESRIGAAGGAMSLLFLVMLVLMVFKPGS